MLLNPLWEHLLSMMPSKELKEVIYKLNEGEIKEEISEDDDCLENMDWLRFKSKSLRARRILNYK